MAKELLRQAIMKFVLSIVTVGVLTFLPAGTFRWWNAWLFAGILFVPMFVTGAITLFKSPELLRKRLNAKEEQAEQRLVAKLSGLMFLAMPLVLGSLPSFVIFLAYPVILAMRISNEEKVLEEELSGYVEYKGRVKYKVIPFLW